MKQSCAGEAELRNESELSGDLLSGGDGGEAAVEAPSSCDNKASAAARSGDSRHTVE